MSNEFPYDVFLSRRSKDKQAVPVPNVVWRLEERVLKGEPASGSGNDI